MIDLLAHREDFPILETIVAGRPLAYLDNAATSQKPQAVIDATDEFYRESNANVHRGVHALSVKATRMFDDARTKVQMLLNAGDVREAIFTKGCTEAINLVAYCLSSPNGWLNAELGEAHRLREGDTILISTMEHHSNIVPWQLAAERTGAQVVPIPITDAGEIDMEAYASLLREHRVRVVGIVHVSNSLGTINPVKEIVRMAHEAGALTMVDGAQAGPHILVDVQDIDADFYSLSCHKIYSPTGIGVLYGKKVLLDAMPPYHGGGDMIRTVSFERTTYAPVPAKYEAGTPNVAGVVGLGAGIEYLAGLGGGGREGLGRTFEAIHAWELALAERAHAGLAEIPGYRRTGEAAEGSGIVSFVVDGVHPHDLGTILDSDAIAIRAGHHCCMPLMKRLGVPATARASFAFYNTEEEADRLVEGVMNAKRMFS
ncbi:SufS family cysteine desulfurase [bacterium]|nr:MAG: SufS family cysteine desulfurase [bacterium]